MNAIRERIQTHLGTDLVRVEAYMQDVLTYVQLPDPMREVLSKLLSSGGKRIRPVLTLLTGRALQADEKAKDRLIRLGALLEIVHMASLVHDDVVDDAPLRRGKPTTQSLYGKNIAVYTGDFLLSRVLSDLLRGRCNRSGEEIAKAVEEMCLGETLQMEARFDLKVTEAQYLGLVRGKTVALFSAAFRVAGIECGVTPEVLDKLTELGICFGYVFQLRDDLLDYVSLEKDEGKAVHADLKAGYYTMPLIRALQGEYGEQIRKLLENPPDDQAVYDKVTELCAKSDAYAYTRERIDAYAKRGLTLLDESAGDGDVDLLKEILKQLASSY